MRLRRLSFAALVAGLTVLLLVLGVAVIAPGGWRATGVALFVCLAVNAPWLALAGATALVGFAIRVGARDPVARVFPLAGRIDPAGPLTLRTAIAVFTRDEPPEPIAEWLDGALRDLARAGYRDAFAACILSDTAEPAVAAREAAAVDALRRRHGGGRVLYRRRTRNDGFKAGNAMSFLDAHHDRFDAFLSLDADSVMTAATMLRLARLMQAEPRLAIVQACFSGTRAQTPFARMLARGHRQGLRVWATGQAWWQGDQGAYWGHNAIVRVAPFRAHCRLERLRDGTPILSHDLVEAARLHGAGLFVRVLADDAGSFEGHPPTLPAMLSRDARWAAGNLQYRTLLRDRRLGIVGRLQMAQAILHYALTPFWFALLPLAALDAASGSGAATPRGALLALLASATAMLHGARLLGYAELLPPRPSLRPIAAECAFTLLLDPIMALEKTARMIALGLRAPRPPAWAVQQRDGRRVTWRAAARLFWPHTLAGAALQAAFVSASPWAGLVALPATAGLLLAIPFASLTSGRRARVTRAGVTANRVECAENAASGNA